MTKREEQVLNAHNQQAEEIRNAGNTVAEGLTAAGNQQVQDLETAEQARADAYNAAQQLYRQRMDQGYKDFADIINTRRTNVMQAEQDAATLDQANRRAAKWTGATELAASIANMIAVGSGNAVSQQYNNYSQGWMQKADRDAREHRARIDNLRERQRMLQQHLTQIRLGDAGQSLANAQREAEAARQARAQIAAAKYQTATTPLNIQLQAAEKAAAAETQGATQAANVGLHEEQMRQSAAQQAAALAQRERQFNAQMEANGYEKDKSGHWQPNEEKMQKIYSSKSARSGSGSNAYLDLPVIDENGNVSFARLRNKEEKEMVMRTAVGAVRRDLGENDAREFESQLDMASTDKQCEEILLEWMGRSKTMEDVLRGYDPNYKSGGRNNSVNTMDSSIASYFPTK